MTQEVFLTTKQIAEHYQKPVGTIRYWRHIGYGPKGTKVGTTVLYPRENVEAFDRELRAQAAAAR
jgi:hypothetical protein